MMTTRTVDKLLGLVAVATAVSGCGPKPKPVASSPVVENLLLETGGVGGTRSSAFSVTGSGTGIKVSYRLQRPSGRPSVLFTIERYKGASQGGSVYSHRESTTGGKIDGEFNVSLVRGSYLLRVDTDVPWSSKIMETR